MVFYEKLGFSPSLYVGQASENVYTATRPAR